MEDNEHNRLFMQGWRILMPELVKDGVPQRVLSAQAQIRAAEALPIFARVLEINPYNWSALFAMGKIYQSHDDHQSALGCFVSAIEVAPEKPDLYREAGISATEIGQNADAIQYTMEALKLVPGDPGLRSNLALALFFSGRPEDAGIVIDKALADAPNDPTTRLIKSYVEEVLAGKRECPRSHRDLLQTNPSRKTEQDSKSHGSPTSRAWAVAAVGPVQDKPVAAAGGGSHQEAGGQTVSSTDEIFLETCDHCGNPVDFTSTGACPLCGGFQGWYRDEAPREAEQWIEAQHARQRVVKRQDEQAPLLESLHKQESLMTWVIAGSLLLGVCGLLVRCS